MTVRSLTKAGSLPAGARRGAAMAVIPLLGLTGSSLVVGPAQAGTSPLGRGPNSQAATPIRHLVVIYQENHSFDNYFGTYPQAANPTGEPAFRAAPGTPAANGLTPGLIAHNPNLASPYRLDRSQEVTCDNSHSYTPLQAAYDQGLVDHFVQTVGPTGKGCQPSLTMGHYDGNTVTALWNYAQHFSMSDSNFADTFGSSVPQALNLISGQAHGAVPSRPTPAVANDTVIANLPPTHDDCNASAAPNLTTLEMTGRNIGDLLNARSVTWGWFTGGFRPTSQVNGAAVCGSSHKNIAGVVQNDYFNGEEDPFQYYASTNNAHHLAPNSLATIGQSDRAHHQYDLADFWEAAGAENMPAVSFLRAPSYAIGHPGFSDPLDEQHFLVTTINRLERLPSWRSTAVVITWDESDGWYDHVMPPIVNSSNDPVRDVLAGSHLCGTPKPGAYLDLCGYGPRIPELVISPYAKANFVDHSPTAQSSIMAFIEDNWGLGRIGNQSFDSRSGSIAGMFDFTRPSNHRLFLDPTVGKLIPGRSAR